MRYIRGFYLVFCTLLACAVQADTIPTLTATAGSADWVSFSGGTVSGPNFILYSPVTPPIANVYLCPPQFPPGGCVGPGPDLFLHPENNYPQNGQVMLAGTIYKVYYEGNAQIQYLTPVISYPAPGPGVSSITIPVILSGFERACLPAPNILFETDPCLDRLGTPGYPNYIANIAIQVPGMLTLLGNGGPSGSGLSGAFFQSEPVPEPTSIALAFISFLLSPVGCRIRSRRTPL